MHPLCSACDADHIAWPAEGGMISDSYAQGHYVNMNRFDASESIESCFLPPNLLRLEQVKKAYESYDMTPATSSCHLITIQTGVPLSACSRRHHVVGACSNAHNAPVSFLCSQVHSTRCRHTVPSASQNPAHFSLDSCTVPLQFPMQ